MADEPRRAVRERAAWTTSRVALLLGFVSVAAALTIGYVSYRHAVAVVQHEHHDFYLNKARILAAAARQGAPASDAVMLARIEALWRVSVHHRPVDEYVCVVDGQAKLLLHTAHPSTVGHSAAKNRVFGAGPGTQHLDELVRQPRDYVGRYVSSSGKEQLAAFAAGPRRRWMIGVHRSMDGLMARVHADVRGLGIGYLVVCGLLMPLSLVLLTLTFRTAQRRRERAEEARAETEAQRQELELRLRQARKMEAIGQLAGGVAHDFNNVLTALLGNVELAKLALQESDGPEQVLEALEEAEHAGRQASGLTRQLLLFSRRQAAQPRVIDVAEAIDSLRKMLPRLVTEEVRVVFDVPADLWLIVADPAELGQVVLNLAVNARDAMPKGGQLTIAAANVLVSEEEAKARVTAQPGRHVCLTVTDTGVGMDEATLERIFEPFFSTKAAGQGTGLGLATVYGVVKGLDGHILASSSPGQGSVFQVCLPAADEGAKPARLDSQPFAQVGGGRGETILVCEDDEAVRRLIERILERAGYRVLLAAEGDEALRLHTESPEVDLLITDVIMPGMNGKEVAEALQARDPALRTLFISGYTSQIIAARGVVEEGIEFLQKPFEPPQLLERARAILDQRAAPAEEAEEGLAEPAESG